MRNLVSKANNNKLSPKEKVKFSILGNRLGLSSNEANNLLINVHKDIANIFSVHESEVVSDVDFLGRDFDLVFTINKKNLQNSEV